MMRKVLILISCCLVQLWIVNSLNAEQTSFNRAAETAFESGQAAFSNRKWLEAVQFFETAVGSQPDNLEFNFWLAKSELSAAANASIFDFFHHTERAQRHLAKALSIQPNHVPSLVEKIAWLRLTAISENHSDQSILKLIEKIETIDVIEGWIQKIEHFELKRQSQSALAIAQQLASLESVSAKGLLKAAFVFQSQRQYEVAYDLFQRVSQLPTANRQQQLNAVYQLGRNAVLGNIHLAEGISALEDYLTSEIGPDLPSKEWAKLRLAFLYFTQGQAKEANSLMAKISFDNNERSLKTEWNKLNQLLHPS